MRAASYQGVVSVLAWALVVVPAKAGVRRHIIGNSALQSPADLWHLNRDATAVFGVRRQVFGSGRVELGQGGDSAHAADESLLERGNASTDGGFAKIASLLCNVNKTDPCSSFKEPVHMPMYRGEFGPETVMVTPVAFFLHTCGVLASTRGCGNMSAFYWFSPHHTDDATCSREPGHEELLTSEEPKNKIGCFRNVTDGLLPVPWRPVPYVAHFWKAALNSKKRYMYAPFQLAIFNKYEKEWGERPTNFLDLPTIRALAKEFKATCGANARVLYSRTRGHSPGEAKDTQALLDLTDGAGLTDVDVMRSQDHVELLEDVYSEWPGLSANEIKLRLLTRTKCFIAAQGGGQFPLAFFGGTNIVFKRRGREDKLFYERVAPKFANQTVQLVKHDINTVLKFFRELMLEHGCNACAKRTKAEVWPKAERRSSGNRKRKRDSAKGIAFQAQARRTSGDREPPRTTPALRAAHAAMSRRKAPAVTAKRRAMPRTIQNAHQAPLSEMRATKASAPPSRIP
jgi:hypothetical protein